MARFDIIEVCPRDGLQNESVALSVAQRVSLIDRLVRAGARRIEAVSVVHPARVPQMAQAEDVVARLPRTDTVRYAGLVLNKRGMDRAMTCDLDEINVVVPCTDEMSEKNQGSDVGGMLATAREIVIRARAEGLFTTLTVAVAFGCPFSGDVPLEKVARVLEAAADVGVDEVALADTIGVGVPDQVSQLIALSAEHAPGIPLRFHFHNTRNTGYANAMRAVAEGIHTLDASVGGYGGCPFAPAATGNIATEDLNYALTRSGHDTGLEQAGLVSTTSWLEDQLHKPATALLGRAGTFPQ
jgi:hydroxymethylglutaryl-CoA lyase